MGIAFRYVSRELLAVFLVTALVLLVIALGGRFMGVSAADVAVLVLHRARSHRRALVCGSGNVGARHQRQLAVASADVDLRQRDRRRVDRRLSIRRRHAARAR